jgi:hypothetical protein
MQDLCFTRYLYPKLDVKQSLLLALLDRHYHEALFWAYELYYSGFQEDTFRYLFSIYETYYQEDNPELGKTLFEKGLENDLTIGTIVMTLSSRNYQICHFLSIYKNTQISKTDHIPSKYRFVILFKETDLLTYQTVPVEPEKSRHYLKSVCKYAIRRNYNAFFETTTQDYKKELWYDWLYYASRSPIWMSRIEEHGGTVVEHNDTKTIEFTNEKSHGEDSDSEDSDGEEDFYQTWGLEPDEQSKGLQEKCIGCDHVKQMTMEDFCKMYGQWSKGSEGSKVNVQLQNSFVLKYD